MQKALKFWGSCTFYILDNMKLSKTFLPSGFLPLIVGIKWPNFMPSREYIPNQVSHFWWNFIIGKKERSYHLWSEASIASFDKQFEKWLKQDHGYPGIITLFILHDFYQSSHWLYYDPYFSDFPLQYPLPTYSTPKAQKSINICARKEYNIAAIPSDFQHS